MKGDTVDAVDMLTADTRNALNGLLGGRAETRNDSRGWV